MQVSTIHLTEDQKRVLEMAKNQGNLVALTKELKNIVLENKELTNIGNQLLESIPNKEIDLSEIIEKLNDIKNLSTIVNKHLKKIEIAVARDFPKTDLTETNKLLKKILEETGKKEDVSIKLTLI